MAAHFEAHLLCQDEHGEGCPGTLACRTTSGRPLHNYPDEPEETVCGSCPLLPTKIERLEQRASDASDGLLLLELGRAGAKFDYPHALTSREWAAIAGIKRGMGRAEDEINRRERAKNKRRNR